MQRQADILLSSIREFIAQPDYPTLVVNGTDASMVFPNRTLAALDRQDEEACYLLYPQPCTDAAAYVGIIADSLASQVEMFNSELASRSLSPLPELPLTVRDTRYPPPERLREAIVYCGTHLPGEAPIVWGLLPAELPNPGSYYALIAPLLAHDTIEPWMDRHRFFVRDHAERPVLVQQLLAAKNDRVLVLDIDFSNERFVQGLVETASDRTAPADERMNAFFQLAAVDFGFQRYPQALEKYGACFNYFQDGGNLAMQALCLSGAGDAMRQVGRPAAALTFYQQSLALGVDAQSIPLIHQGAVGAGTACLELSRDEEAAGYFRHADEAASKLHNPYAKCDAMEKRGLVAWRLGKVDEAVELWVKGKELAKRFVYFDRAASILGYLIAACRQASLPQRAFEFERERASLAAAPTPPGAPS